jgi:hypothetical protein
MSVPDNNNNNNFVSINLADYKSISGRKLKFCPSDNYRLVRHRKPSTKSEEPEYEWICRNCTRVYNTEENDVKPVALEKFRLPGAAVNPKTGDIVQPGNDVLISNARPEDISSEEKHKMPEHWEAIRRGGFTWTSYESIESM